MQVSLKSSYKLTLFFGVLHASVAVAIWISLAPLWLKILGSCICLWRAIYILRRYVWLNASHAVVKIVLGADQKWQLIQKNGCVAEADLKGDTIILPFMLILNFKQLGGQSVSVLICLDSVEKAQYRRLCVQLKTRRSSLTGRNS